MSEEIEKRGHRKERLGIVVSDKMQKSIVVKVDRRFRHPLYKKVITSHRKFNVHDEKEEANIGDRVKIIETRPLSKTKRWRLVEVIDRNLDAVTKDS